MQLQTSFDDIQRASIETLRKDLTRRIQRTVTAEFGATDDGLVFDVALCVESLPFGSWGTPGPLVSFVKAQGREGLGLMAPDGSVLADGLCTIDAVKAARFAAVREYRAMTKGATRAA